MFIILLNWIYIFITSFAFGFLACKAIQPLLKNNKPSLPNPVIISISGLSILTFLFNYFSIFSRINIEANIFLIIPTLIIIFSQKKHLKNYLNKIKTKFNSSTILFGIIILIIALFKSSSISEIDDEGQYFLPLVRWIENYPITPGTGLFHDRMGYNSAFHLSNAIYGHTYFFKGGLYDLNAYLFVIINFFFLDKVNLLIEKNYKNWTSILLASFAVIILYDRSS